MSNVNAAAIWTTSGKQLARVIPFTNPITSFNIPGIVVECAFSHTDVDVSFGALEEIEVVHPRTKEKYNTCRISVSINKVVVGYIPLPLQYRETWLELSYNNKLYYQMWDLWEKEYQKATSKSEKEKCKILHKTTSIVVAQHSISRLLAIEELLTLFLDMALIYPPDNLAAWLNGDIEFLEDKFHETLKSEALKSLKTPDAFTETQFVTGAVLPTRWHEGQEPLPNFWLAEQWDWIAEGNSMWGSPTQLLYHVLKAKPALTYPEFKRVLDSLMKNHSSIRWQQAFGWVKRSGSTSPATYIKFTSIEATFPPHGKKEVIRHYPANPFNTVEIRLVLEGYLRRKEVATSQNSGRQDVTLRSCIHIISLDQHDDCWAKIIDEVDLGKPVQEVLEMAAGWWSEHLKKQERLAALAKERSGASDSDNGEAVVVLGADGGANNSKQFKDLSTASVKAAVAEGDVEVSQQSTGPSADDQIMANGENHIYSGTTCWRLGLRSPSEVPSPLAHCQTVHQVHLE
ncbi:hypothetical protein EDD22DRAFT_848224 [Suillus occidentalis]|nr:hypothetical protein EDD22DRAFT_848224 [Suillus occidentalis]